MTTASQHAAADLEFGVLDTTPVDRAFEALGNQYVNHDMQLRDDGRDFHVVQYSLSCGSIHVDRIAHSSAVYRVPIGPMGAHFAVMASFEGAIRVTSAGNDVDLHDAGSVVLDNRRSFRMDWTSDAKSLLVRIETTAVRRHLTDLLGDVAPLATFELRGPPTYNDSVRWNAAARFIEVALQHPPDESEIPLWRDELERFTVLQMLTTHPNSVLNHDAPVQPAGASTAAARATADYLRLHCRQTVRISELAAQFGISVRALQLGFRRVYGVTPHEYLREARLQSAHLDLTSDPGVSITDVAYRWGFSSPSRFSRYYREYFGTPPSAANRRGYAVTDGQDRPRELRPAAAPSG